MLTWVEYLLMNTVENLYDHHENRYLLTMILHLDNVFDKLEQIISWRDLSNCIVSISVACTALT